MIAWLSRNGSGNANLFEYGIPVYHSAVDTTRYQVHCTMETRHRCPFDRTLVPIPDGARPHTGSDGAMVVVDDAERKVYEFWQAERTENRWTASFGAVNDLDGPGWGGGSTASGASRLGGVVLLSEIAQGVIPHALAVQTDNICAKSYRAPALSTDGRSTRADCIPEGARLRLDPEVNLDGLAMTVAETAVARALQTYGAYVVDGGGAALSISFELDQAAGPETIGQVWEQSGLRWDYDDMSHVPWNRLQVLS